MCLLTQRQFIDADSQMLMRPDALVDADSEADVLADLRGRLMLIQSNLKFADYGTLLMPILEALLTLIFRMLMYLLILKHLLMLTPLMLVDFWCHPVDADSDALVDADSDALVDAGPDAICRLSTC